MRPTKVRLIHRLILKRYDIPPDSVLNRGSSPPVSAGSREIATDLRRIIGTLKVEGFEETVGRVDYTRLRLSPTYAEYQECAARLRTFDPANLVDDQARLAFWINLYNALIVDYGILRANRGHPAIPGPHFGVGDPRLTFSLRRLDPRIHFALVCAARSCPRITVYDAADINAQLDLAARTFIHGGGVQVDRARDDVRLPRICQWYAPDFGARPLGLGDRTPLLNYVSSYLADEASRDYVLADRPRVRFMRYDWSLNQ